MNRPCLDCGALTSESRCAVHRRADWRARNRRRDPLARAVYQSADYRRARALVMAGAYRCDWCGATGVPLTCGHVIGIHERPDLATDPANLRPSCVSCQNLAANRRRPAR